MPIRDYWQHLTMEYTGIQIEWEKWFIASGSDSDDSPQSANDHIITIDGNAIDFKQGHPGTNHGKILARTLGSGSGAVIVEPIWIRPKGILVNLLRFIIRSHGGIYKLMITLLPGLNRLQWHSPHGSGSLGTGTGNALPGSP